MVGRAHTPMLMGAEPLDRHAYRYTKLQAHALIQIDRKRNSTPTSEISSWQYPPIPPLCPTPSEIRSGFAVRCTEPAVKYLHIPTPAPPSTGILVGIWSSNTPPGRKTLTQCNSQIPYIPHPTPYRGYWGIQLTGALLVNQQIELLWPYQ